MTNVPMTYSTPDYAYVSGEITVTGGMIIFADLKEKGMVIIRRKTDEGWQRVFTPEDYAEHFEIRITHSEETEDIIQICASDEPKNIRYADI